MRPCRCLLVCLPFLASAGCALDAPTGPETAPPSTPMSDGRWTGPDRPTDVILRGPKSIRVATNGNRPLWVVDGVVLEEAPRLTGDDIESIEVLKGAPAAALYGERAAHGVIFVHTRGGGR